MSFSDTATNQFSTTKTPLAFERSMRTSSRRANVLCFFFLLCVLFYLPIEELLLGMDSPIQPFNYVAVILSFLSVLSFPIRLNREIFFVHFIIFVILIINNLFAPHASDKWLLNQTGFLGCSFIISSAYAGASKEEAEKIRKFIIRVGVIGFIILLLCCLYLVKDHNTLLIAVFRSRAFNSLTYQLTLSIRWSKQSLGNFAALIFAIIFIFKCRKTPLFLLLCSPLLVGIRTFWLSTFCTLLLIQTKKRYHFLLIIPCACVLAAFVVSNYHMFSSGLLDARHRVAAYLNAYEIVKTMPFGIGLGQYHNYVADLAINHFRYRNDIVALAPESDIVLVFGSLGFFPGLIFYLVNLWVLVRLRKIYRELSDVDRFFAFFFFVFLFLGISQDNMFSLPYWISFGFALGVVISTRSDKQTAMTFLDASAK